MEVTFHDLSFLTRPGRVMTPRPATEALVEAALERLGARPARVADVGTGSGAVAVALAVRAPLAEVWATDTSEEAVELARRNAARHGVADRVHVVAGDLLEPVPGRLDLVVANLPYLPDRLAAHPAYAEYGSEPEQAIFAPGDGLDHYRRLLAACAERLAEDGAVLIQLHRRVLAAERTELGDLRAHLASTAFQHGAS